METSHGGAPGLVVNKDLAAGRLLAIRELVRDPVHVEGGTAHDFGDLLAIGGLRTGLLRCLHSDAVVAEASSQAA
jgi:hypothetical protein